jgi:hypothetical protein
VASSRFIGVQEPVPEVHQGLQVLDLAGAAPGIDAAQEQHFRGEPGTDTRSEMA